jgi:hypothetical protein
MGSPALARKQPPISGGNEVLTRASREPEYVITLTGNMLGRRYPARVSLLSPPPLFLLPRLTARQDTCDSLTPIRDYDPDWKKE